ncbi:MAG: universal stress protein [Sandaracinaceae bacterium]|nr:universal stress protein [Sandaracinaceae bacterium]
MSPRSILVACDFSAPSRRALEWARLLHARLHAAVVLVCVEEDPLAQGSFRPTQESWVGEREQGERHAFLEQRLRALCGEVFGPDEQAVQTKVVSGRAADRIVDVALEAGCDLVIAGSSGKNAVDRVLLGSTTHELVRACPLPVMVVH